MLTGKDYLNIPMYVMHIGTLNAASAGGTYAKSMRIHQSAWAIYELASGELY